MGLMRERNRYPEPGRAIYRSQRWRALRIEVLRRDGFRCCACGARGRLEVDHIEPVKTAPERAWELGNLQALCRSCHTRKTRSESGHPPLSGERQAWRKLLHQPFMHEESIEC